MNIDLNREELEYLEEKLQFFCSKETNPVFLKILQNKFTEALDIIYEEYSLI